MSVSLPSQPGRGGDITIEIIGTFDVLEQIMFSVPLAQSEATEKEFLRHVFSTLNEEEKSQLVKLSCCQLYTDREEDVLPWIMKRNGKYYFEDKDGKRVTKGIDGSKICVR